MSMSLSRIRRRIEARETIFLPVRLPQREIGRSFMLKLRLDIQKSAYK